MHNLSSELISTQTVFAASLTFKICMLPGSPYNYQNWDRGMPFGKRALAVLMMNRRGKWINHYADKVLSQYNSVAICKFKS